MGIETGLNEKSFIMAKPDAVQRGLVGQIISRFEARGYKLIAIRTLVPTEALLRQHYEDLVEKPFFKHIVAFMTSGPVVAMVWEGKNIVKNGRTMLGATDPSASAPGTIRGDFGIDTSRNICHGSDSVESANREIKLWFDEKDIVDEPQFVKDLVYGA